MGGLFGHVYSKEKCMKVTWMQNAWHLCYQDHGLYVESVLVQRIERYYVLVKDNVRMIYFIIKLRTKFVLQYRVGICTYSISGMIEGNLFKWKKNVAVGDTKLNEKLHKSF